MKPWLWLLSLFILPMIGFTAVWASKSRWEAERFNGHQSLPNFQLIDQLGETKQRDDFVGKVWVANFIFTSCAGQCPLLTQKMREFRNKMEPFPGLLTASISVDPARDTVPKLREYAEKFDAPNDTWFFLTGERNALENLVEKGFRVTGGFGKDESSLVAHTSKFVLINRYGQVHGYYDLLEDEKGIEKLAKDTRKLLLERF